MQDIVGQRGAPEAMRLDAHGHRAQDKKAHERKTPDQQSGQRQHKINAVRLGAGHDLYRVLGRIGRCRIGVVEPFPGELEDAIHRNQQNAQQDNRPAVEKPQANAVFLGLICPVTGREQQINPQYYGQNDPNRRDGQQSYVHPGAHKPIAGQIPAQRIIFYGERTVKPHIDSPDLSVFQPALGRGHQHTASRDPISAQRRDNTVHLSVAVYAHQAHAHIAAVGRIFALEYGGLLLLIGQFAV